MTILHLTLIVLFIQQFEALPLGDPVLIQELSEEDCKFYN